ncbi:MAG: hypothetical protein ACD_20C00157G0005 [uncultured bacterium]|nr:MAG: hypothetical protein ACD_20C00157G0005 [uncultured bacterium]HBH18094.1 glycine cleavage system aminomethyltransferase GcvT [Cyanobacteria bacterium UBA9579]
MEKIKRTPLYEEHLKLSAKMVPFGGWEMPLQYGSIIDEHLTVRNYAGLFDVSHMGEFFISGTETINFLQKLVPQNIAKLAVGKAVYSQLINQNGGIIDDLIIYRLEDKDSNPNFLLIVNASRIENDLNWIEFNKKNGQFEVEIENKSDELAMIALQGPLATEIIQELGLSKEDQPTRFSIKETKLNSFKVLISHTGYTGEDGFEIIINNEDAPSLWQELLSKGQGYGIKPIGLGARDTLRLEAAMLLYGQDMTEKTTPVEASLSWSIPVDKEEDYYGKDIILSQLSGKKLDKILVGFRMLDKSIPRHDYEIFKDDEKVGCVTSGGIAPFVGANIGLGYVNTDIPTSIGSKIDISIRGKLHPAEIVKRPFYTRSRRA